MSRNSGNAPFVFELREDLHTLPPRAQQVEVHLHGGFAVDQRPGFGEIYYGAPGCGLMRIASDLQQQDIIELPAALHDVNFHSARIGLLDGQTRLFLPANQDQMVVVLDLDGRVEFTLPRPELDAYLNKDAPFRPTDVLPDGDRLFVADGYGSNYILEADLRTRAWLRSFGGPTDDPTTPGRFGTAHGLGAPSHTHLAIADRPHSRIQIMSRHGHFHGAHHLPDGSRPCGVHYAHCGGRHVALVASLDDPDPGRPAPIYILDADTYDVLSVIRPKEDLGVELADHIHNAIWHELDGQLYIIAQAWNPGYFFILGQV